MNVALRPPVMTVEEFLAWEERQELKHEFDGFRPVAMTGVREAHAVIQVNLISTLNGLLRGTPCRVIGSDLKIAVTGRIRYPDAFVICAPPVVGRTVVREPVVVFEIASGSTSYTDRFLKRREYEATASIARYVLLEQTGPAATVFTRPGWDAQPVDGRDSVLALPEIGVVLPLAALYHGLDFAEVTDAP